MTHLGDATGLSAIGPVGIDSHRDTNCAEHAYRRERDAIEPAPRKQVDRATITISGATVERIPTASPR